MAQNRDVVSVYEEQKVVLYVMSFEILSPAAHLTTKSDSS